MTSAGANCRWQAVDKFSERIGAWPDDRDVPRLHGVPVASQNRPRCSAGIRPALTSDDLPLPELPITTSTRERCRRSSSSLVSRSRPKNSHASSGIKGLQAAERAVGRPIFGRHCGLAVAAAQSVSSRRNRFWIAGDDALMLAQKRRQAAMIGAVAEYRNDLERVSGSACSAPSPVELRDRPSSARQVDRRRPPSPTSPGSRSRAPPSTGHRAEDCHGRTTRRRRCAEESRQTARSVGVGARVAEEHASRRRHHCRISSQHSSGVLHVLSISRALACNDKRQCRSAHSMQRMRSCGHRSQVDAHTSAAPFSAARGRARSSPS